MYNKLVFTLVEEYTYIIFKPLLYVEQDEMGSDDMYPFL